MVKTNARLHLKNVAAIGLTAGLISPLMALEGLRPVKALATPSMMEFRWDTSDNYKKLYYWQSSSVKRGRAKYFLIMKPRDRKTAILKLSISIPEYFDANITPKKLSLCKVHLGGMLEKTKCKEKVPAVFEVNKAQTSIEVFPNQPIPADKDSYAVVMKIFNPNRPGMFQLNAMGQSPGDLPISGYIGSWNIDIN